VGNIPAAFLSTASLSRAAGVGRETLRFYEEQGLIKPIARTAAGYRQFSQQAVSVITFIKHAQRAGFSLKEIKQLLDLRANEQDTCGVLSEVLGLKLTEIDAELHALQEKRAALVELVSACSKQDAARVCGYVRKGPGCC
jgi:MerR family transcriptional regulator, copper efflux regulator